MYSFTFCENMRLFVFSILILLGFCLNAQVLKIRDFETLKPLPYATVSCLETNYSFVTNKQGELSFNKVSECSHLQVRMMGYVPKMISYNELASSGFQIYLIPEKVKIPQVEISAPKWNSKIKTGLYKKINLSKSNIVEQNVQTSADLFSEAGYVYVQKSQQSGGSPMIRGFAASRLLLMFDGLRMNNAVFRSGNIQNIITIDPFAIENTSVFFGPGAIMYGSDAIGGVISFETLAAKMSTSDSMNTSGTAYLRTTSANDEICAHLDFNLGWEKYAMLTSISINQFGDLRMGKKGPDEYLRKYYVKRVNGVDQIIRNRDSLMQIPSDYKQINLLQKIVYKPSENTNLKYTLYYSTSSDNSRYDRLIREKDGLPVSAEWYYGPQTWMFNSLSFDTKQTGLFYDKMNLKFSYQIFEESRFNRGFNEITRYCKYEHIDAFTAKLDFNKTLSEKDDVNYGFESVYNLVDSKGENINILNGQTQTAPSRYPDSNWASHALYISYNRIFNDKLFLSTGLRYNRYLLNAVFDNTFYNFPFSKININDGVLTGSVGISINLYKDYGLTLNFSNGYRSPNIDDIGKVFDSEPGAVIVPNQELEAEIAYSFDLGINKVFYDLVRVDFSCYYTYFDNAMVRDDFTFNGQDSIIYQGELSKVQALQNASFAQVYGLNSLIELKIGRKFILMSVNNWQKGFERLESEDSPMRHIAPFHGKTSISYSYLKAKATFYSLYNGEISFVNMPVSELSKPYLYIEDENGNLYSPSWITFNVSLQYSISSDLIIALALENITNRRYRPYSSGITAKGRSFLISAKFVF